MFPSVSYVSGQRLTAADQSVKITGAFTDPTWLARIYFVPTLAEAVVKAITPELECHKVTFPTLWVAQPDISQTW